MNDPTLRRRDPAEFFGLERALWEDRKSGALCAGYLAQLDAAEADFAAAAALGADDATTQRTRDVLDAVRAARDVLTAAGEAMQDRAPVFMGPRA